MAATQPADGATFQKVHNLLIKSEKAINGQIWNTLDTVGMMYLILVQYLDDVSTKTH